MQGMIAYAKANPGKLSVGTPGIGTPHSLAALMLNAVAGIEMTQVPYKGTAPALNDLLGGQIPLMWATPNVVMQYVRNRQGEGARRGVAANASRCLPNVPTVSRERRSRFRCQRLVRHRRAGQDAARRNRARSAREIARDRQDAGRARQDGAARL